MEKLFCKISCLLEKHFSRRKFLKTGIAGFFAFWANSIFLGKSFAGAPESKGRRGKNIKGNYDLVVAEGADPYKNTVRAVEEMGGMSKFVKPGDVVVVKPNIAWDRSPAQAANVDPNVVSALVDMAYKAGAKRVKVFDRTCNDERRCYENSGIAAAARKSGADVFYADLWHVVKARFPYDSKMEDWPILRDAVECDVFINVPVLKDHGLAGLTISMKNLMGICAGMRALIHVSIGEKLVDLTDFIKPDLNVVDATRVLTDNGPSGGNLEDVVRMDKVIVSTDATLADVYGAKLAGRDPMRIPNIRVAAERGFGSVDVEDARVRKIAVT